MNAARPFASASARHARTLTTVAALALTPLAMLPTRPAMQWLDAICSTPLHSVASSPGAAAQRPTSTSHTLSCEPLANAPGKSVTTVVVDFPPHAFTGAHRHPGSVTAYVISGTLRSALNGGPAIDYRSGQTWFEPPGTLHDYVENTDPEIGRAHV